MIPPKTTPKTITNDKSEIFRHNARVYQILKNPRRLAIIHLITDQELTVGKISQKTGYRKANVSQHLAILKKNHLAKSKRHGRFVYYRCSTNLIKKLRETLYKITQNP